MSKVTVTETHITIQTYPEGEPEALPVFAENRVHQRTSGNPYPNAVTVNVRSSRTPEPRRWRAVVIANDYIQVTLLPDLGGRIFRAVDKTTGKDFFYRQNVIKPALIGMLGAWISGGVEFNWPTHHRPSTFLPVDYTVEETERESIVWLYEHDVCDRMLGAVGIVLRPDRAYFETRVRVCNRTPLAKSFLWWENAAVPASPDLRIFFPQDVGHVYFHYKRNTTAYPITGGWFNGHRLPENTDISRHGNTVFPTSYFSAASEYDYFGGYDERTGQGVVHVADHHLSPGKKMFTWAYNQLSKTWENALTDTDGPYLELMAGSYSDNQPDFSWLAPYEEKRFSQYWYPIHETGVPCYANLNLAVSIGEDCALIKSTGDFGACDIRVSDEAGVLAEKTECLRASGNLEIAFSRKAVGACHITVGSETGSLAEYTTRKPPVNEHAPVIEGYPTPDECASAEEALLTGTHVVGYRDPAANAERYFLRAIALSKDSYEAYASLAECRMKRGDYQSAYENIESAWKLLTMRDARPRSGRIPYLRGAIAAALGRMREAEKAYWDAYFCADTKDAALVRIAMLDGLRGDYAAARRHAEESRVGMSAEWIAVLAARRIYERPEAAARLSENPMSQALRWAAVLCGEYDRAAFFAELRANPSQTCIDLYDDLTQAGFEAEAEELLRGLTDSGRPFSCMVSYLLGETPANRSVERMYPFRECERTALEAACRKGDRYAEYLLGCLVCGRRSYARARELFADCGLPEGLRGEAVCLWRLGRKQSAFEKLLAANEGMPGNEQLLWEVLKLANRLAIPAERLSSVLDDLSGEIRDDICTEYALLLCRRGQPEGAAALMEGHRYIPCEGGEGAVADVWIRANAMLADRLLVCGDYVGALKRYQKAETLPENLGSGWWNDAKKAPMRYAEGQCLRKLGEEAAAEECDRWITELRTDFFSDMGLPELDLYKIRAYRNLGDRASALATADSARKRWEEELCRVDSGYFATTPFFDSFFAESDAPLERRARYGELLEALEKIM